MTTIDAHLHVWDLASGDYEWLGPEHGALHRSFTSAEASRQLAAAGVDAAVLVQAADTEADTRTMLAIAAEEPLVAGVVGWVALEDPDRAARQLDTYGGDPAFVGVRQLVHDDPRDDVLDLAPVRTVLGRLVERGLPLDVPDAWPRHLGRLPALADEVDGLVLVVDHLGKPPRGTGGMADWEAALREVARRPRVVAKVSGLQVPGQPFTVDALRPVWEVALDAFGPERLMYGGDWPMTVPDGGYEPHWEVVRTLVDELTNDEQAAVLSATARAVYGVDV
ncbi:L-fuconolactonase [Mumia flava]|uniref:L-fuconolactonase n=1 Tax=Mumia flava TaxID=1348852 RepID=A0A0B2BE62_9ACTN|nr:amidohydrolase family protein [Mumia flava]PJJ53711.1 L-fuconolactonase [Mumia flava]